MNISMDKLLKYVVPSIKNPVVGYNYASTGGPPDLVVETNSSSSFKVYAPCISGDSGIQITFLQNPELNWWVDSKVSGSFVLNFSSDIDPCPYFMLTIHNSAMTLHENSDDLTVSGDMKTAAPYLNTVDLIGVTPTSVINVTPSEDIADPSGGRSFRVVGLTDQYEFRSSQALLIEQPKHQVSIVPPGGTGRLAAFEKIASFVSGRSTIAIPGITEDSTLMVTFKYIASPGTYLNLPNYFWWIENRVSAIPPAVASFDIVTAECVPSVPPISMPDGDYLVFITILKPSTVDYSTPV